MVGTRIRRSLALAAAAAASLTMLAGAARPPAAQAQAQAGTPGESPVDVWITTANGQQELTQQAPVSFSASPPANLTVTVDPTRTFQA